MVTGFYKDLIKNSDHLVPFCLTGAFPRIEVSCMDDMGSVPSDQEIHDVLHSMGVSKLLEWMAFKLFSIKISGMLWVLLFASWLKIALQTPTRLPLLTRL